MSLARGLKAHLRVLAIHGVTLRVVTLRPQTHARLSTNYFHDTWHILGGPAGAIVLGRLVWGLAFQRQPGTLVLIEPPHVVPTPFEADPPDPILLVPDAITHVDDDLLRALRLRLRRSPPQPTTIRWHTFGMIAALAAAPPHRRRWRREPGATRERISRRAGYLCYTAPPAILRSTGLGIYQMHEHTFGNYLPFAETDLTSRWHHDGEFQLIPGFDDSVSGAIVARRELLGDRPLLADDHERHAVWNRTHDATGRLRDARKRPAP
ncbi:MAG: hypothetical protein ABI867_07740 [Kofleriaceae bacterium]